MHRDRDLDGAEDGIPLVEDHSGTRSERVELLERDVRVLMPVPFEPGEVELFAVHLNADAVIDEQINHFTARDPNLRYHRMPARSQPGAGKALGQAVTHVVHPVAYAPVIRWKLKQQLLEVEHIQRTSSQGPVESSDRCFQTLVQNNAAQGVAKPYGCHRAAFAQLTPIPMEYNTTACSRIESNPAIVLRTQPRSIGWNRDMQRMGSEHPSSGLDNCGDTGQSAPDPQRTDSKIRLRQCCIPPLPCPAYRAVAHRPGQIEISYAARNELLLLGQAAE